MPARILSVVGDRTLGATRRELLQSAGYAVVTTTSVTEALLQLSSSGWDLVIIGHATPPAERDLLMKECRLRNVPKLLLHLGEVGLVRNADYHFDLGDGPEAFLAAVADCLASKK